MEESPEEKIVPRSQSSRELEQATTLSATANTSATSAEHERLEASQAGTRSLPSSPGEQGEHDYGLEDVDSATNECLRQTSVTNPAPSYLGPAEKPTSSDSCTGALPTIVISDWTQNQGHFNKGKRKCSEFTGRNTKASYFRSDDESPGIAGMSCSSSQKVPRKENQPGGKESDNARYQAPQAEQGRDKSPLAQQGHLHGEMKGAVATVSASRRQASTDESLLSDVVGDNKSSKDGSPGIHSSESTHNEGSGSGAKRKSSKFTTITSDAGKHFLKVGADTHGTVATQFLSPPKKPRRHSFPGRTEETERTDHSTKSAARPAAEGHLSCPTEFLLLAEPIEDENSERTIPKRRTEMSIGISSTQPVAETCSSNPGQGSDCSKATATTSDTGKLSGATLPTFLATARSPVRTHKLFRMQETRHTASSLRGQSKTAVISSCPELGADESQPRETPFERGILSFLTLPSLFVTAVGDEEAQKSAGTQETAHTDSISPSASVVGEKTFCTLGGRDSSEAAATPLEEANLSPLSRLMSLLAASPDSDSGRAAGISSKPTAPSAHTFGAEVGRPEVAGVPIHDNSSVPISHPLLSQTRENVNVGKFAEIQSGYDGSNLSAQSVAATSSSTRNVAGSSHISVSARQELVRSQPFLVSLPTGNTEDVNSPTSTRLSATQDTTIISPPRTGASTASSYTGYQFSVTQVSTMLQNVQLPPEPASRSQPVPAESQSCDSGNSAGRQESGYGERFSSAYSEEATSSSTEAVAESSNTTVAAGQEVHGPCSTLVALLTGNTEKDNADTSTWMSGYRNTTQVPPARPVADWYHQASEDVIRDSELLLRQYDSSQQAYVVEKTAAEQFLSTDQDAGPPQQVRETLLPHHGAQAQHYEQSQPIGMHQQAGAALPQSAPPFDSGDAGIVTQRINISDLEDSVPSLETVLLAVQQELSHRSMTQREINSSRSGSSRPRRKLPPPRPVARLQAKQAPQLKSSRQGMMQQLGDPSATDHLVPSVPLPTQEQVPRTTAIKWDSPPWSRPSGVEQARFISQSFKKPVPTLKAPYVEESAVTHAIASAKEQRLQLHATIKLSMLHRQRRPHSPSASTSQKERHPSDHLASVPNTSILPSAAKPCAPMGNEVVEEMNEGGTEEESSQISECPQPTLVSSAEHSSHASYHEDSAAGQPRDANYAQPEQLATMPFLRRARQIRLQTPPNMSFFNPYDFPPANKPFPELANIDMEQLNERDATDELQVSELLQGSIMPRSDPSSNVKTRQSTTFTGQPSSASLSTVPNALPRRMPSPQTAYFPYSTTSQDAQLLVRNVPHSSTAEQSYENTQPHPTCQQPSFMPSQGAVAAPSDQESKRTTSTGCASYAQETAPSTFSASSHDTPYFGSSSTPESAQVSTHNMPHSSSATQNYEHLQQHPMYQYSSFLLSQGANAAPSDQGTKRDISTGPVLYAQETPSLSLSASSYDIAYSAPTTSEGAQALPHSMPHAGTAEQNYENFQPLTSFSQLQGAIASPSDQAAKRTTSAGSILFAQGTPSSSFSGSSYDYFASSPTSEGTQIFNRTMPLSGTAEQNYEHLQPHPMYQEPLIMSSQGAAAATSEQAARRNISTGNIVYTQEAPSSSFATLPYDTAYFASSSTSESTQVSTHNMPHSITRAQNYEHLQHPVYQHSTFLPLQGATSAPSDHGTKRGISAGPILYAQETPSSSFSASAHDIAYSAFTTSERAQTFPDNMPHTGTAEQNYEHLQPLTTYQQSSFLHSQGAIAAPSDQATKRTISTGPILFVQGTPLSSFSGSSYGTAYFASSSTSESTQVFNRTMPHSGTAEQNSERMRQYLTYQQPSVTPSQTAGAVSSGQPARRTIATGSLSYAQGAPSSTFSASPYDTPYFASSSTSESAPVFTHNMSHSIATAQNNEQLQQHPTSQQLSIMPSQGTAAAPSDQEIRRII